jgi:hypothetical protein
MDSRDDVHIIWPPIEAMFEAISSSDRIDVLCTSREMKLYNSKRKEKIP